MNAESHVIIIDQAGRIQMIVGHGPDLTGAGRASRRRASHVEPVSWPLRLLFHGIRSVAHDDSAAAAWTRSWRCLWRVRIIGGPVLAGGWRDRAAAIAAEVQWLEENQFS
jgi:hypothetical protein